MAELLKEQADSALNIILANFKPNVIYFAHNLIFDFSLIFSAIRRRGIEFKWVFINYKLFEVRLLLQSKTIILRCSYKILPLSLSKMQPFFTKKCKIDFPYEKLLDWVEHQNIKLCINGKFVELGAIDALTLHAMNDCLILKESLLYFYNTLNSIFKAQKNRCILIKAMSAGGIALNLLTNTSKQKIKLNLDAGLITHLRGAYRGGRCEVFGNPRLGEKVLHFDYANMYLSCMAGAFPTNSLTLVESPKNMDIPGFYFIEIEYYGEIPVLPVKRDKLIFPAGKLRGLY